MDEATATINKRLYSIDLLRGLVMIIMLLDHVRDFVHAGALAGSPTDMAKPDAILFFTRWITHFCAPVFVFLSGTSIYLRWLGGKTRPNLSRFLITRGFWLIFLEFTVVRFSMFFNFDYRLLGMAEVIWVFGVSMIVLAALVYLPTRVVGAIGIAMIVLHNLLDGIVVPPAISMAETPPANLWQSIWLFLHQPGFVFLFGGATKVFAAYPLIPWIGVMAVGYAFGSVYSFDADRRRKILMTLGAAATMLFIAARAVNIYGDPSRWGYQANAGYTVLSFLNTTKYPPSLLFLLMTLGPAILLLAAADRIDGRSLLQRIPITFGRVPLFYFILQMFYAHGCAVLFGVLAGRNVDYLFLNFPEWVTQAPPGSGFPLWVVYASWITGVVLLYPLCVWYGGLKQRNRSWYLSYI